MKKSALAVILCLFALATQAAVPMFSAAAQNTEAFTSALKASKVTNLEGKELPVVDEGGNVNIARLSAHLHIWAKDKGHLTDEAAADPKVFVTAMVEQYGQSVSITDLATLSKGQGFTVPAKVDRKLAPQANPVAQPVKTVAAPAASAPISTPVAKAPVVAPKTPEPATPTITVEQLTEIARGVARSETQGLTKAVGTLNARIDAKADEQALNALRASANAATNAANAATGAINAAKVNFEQAQAKLDDAGRILQQQANKLPEMAATAAQVAADSAVASGLATVDGRFTAANNKTNSVYLVALTALVLGALVAAGLYFLWRRLSKVETKAVEAAEAKAIEVVAPLQKAVKKLDHDVEAVKAVLGDKYKVFSFDKAVLTAEIAVLQVGGVLAVNFTVEGDRRQHQVMVARISETQVALRGIVNQDDKLGVNIGNAVARIMRAYNRSELATQKTTTSVVQMVDQLPTVREELAA